MKTSSKQEGPDDGVFRTTRMFPYPAQSVFAAFERPDLLSSWWGPSGFTSTFEIFEFRTGGRWKFVMRGPDGSKHANESVFLEVHAPSKLVIRHLSQPHFVLTVTLADHDGGTEITWSQAFEDKSVAFHIRHVVEPANEQNLDRLGAVLAA